MYTSSALLQMHTRGTVGPTAVPVPTRSSKYTYLLPTTAAVLDLVVLDLDLASKYCNKGADSRLFYFSQL